MSLDTSSCTVWTSGIHHWFLSWSTWRKYMSYERLLKFNVMYQTVDRCYFKSYISVCVETINELQFSIITYMFKLIFSIFWQLSVGIEPIRRHQTAGVEPQMAGSSWWCQGTNPNLTDQPADPTRLHHQVWGMDGFPCTNGTGPGNRNQGQLAQSEGTVEEMWS